ncbi:MAG: hypothetical protein ACRBBW_18725 [Cellvibrionaceae bacterium]
MSNTESTYRVVFWGGLMLGQSRLQVAKRFARQFKIRAPRQLQQLFSGRLLTLKSGLDYEQARHYSDAIRLMGGICRIELETNPLTSKFEERQARAVQSVKPQVAADFELLTAQALSRESLEDLGDDSPFAAREPSTQQHPPCKYFDARASSLAVKQSQKRL